MSPTFLPRTLSKGNAATPILIILGALTVSGGIFFVYTKKKMEQNESARVVMTALEEKPASDTVAPVAPTPEVPSPTPKPAPLPGFARPADVGQQLARSLAAGDMEAAANLLSAGDLALASNARAVLDKMKELGFKAAPEDQVALLGQVENSMKLAIPLQRLDGSPTEFRLFLDVIKDAKMGWKIGTLHLPKELEAALTKPSDPAIAMTPGSVPLSKPLIVVDEAPDALTFASDFVAAVLKPDYEAAGKLTDDRRVPAMKLAGLCIVFEDGQYELQNPRPLTATVATATTSWIIAKVKSDAMKEETEFGLEMEKWSGGWRVIGLNLSQLLADSAKASAQSGIPYTPLVKNPKGGESIALYYEYDQANLHPRAQKQLAIIASILKSSPGKKLKIGGYTDAMGTDDYNIALSKKRAEAVKQFFLDDGVPLAQVDTIGFGKANPLGPNANPDGTDNPDGRSRNRRAEILLDF